MSIMTRTGDCGMTSLYCGPRVRKDDPRIEFYGTLDELCSFLGVAKSLMKGAPAKKALESIQRDLFIIGAELATPPRFVRKLRGKIGAAHVSKLEALINGYEKKWELKECRFYLPGGNAASAALDVARTVCRRAERKLVALKRKKALKNNQCLIYLNRASDLLYLLARMQSRSG